MAHVALFAAFVATLVALSVAQDSCPSSDYTGCYTSSQTFFCCPTPSTSCSGSSMPECVATGTSNVVSGAAVVPGAPPAPIGDVDILNFALNLEYLEAEFYSWAAYGHGLDSSLTGGSSAGPVIGGQKANLSSEAQAYAEQIAQDEIKHVKFLKFALGSAAVDEPEINIGSAFATAANAAAEMAFGVSELNPPFSPYSSDVTFLLGAFIFEDVGVTAYAGAVPLFNDKNTGGLAARILGVEAYHAGAIRDQLSDYVSAQSGYGVTVGQVGNAITALRAALGDGNETPLTDGNGITQLRAVTEEYALAYARDTSKVIAIVCGGQNEGLFLPKGFNGKIKSM